MESYFPTDSGTQSQAARERVLEDLHVLIVDAETLLNATVSDMSEKVAVARDRLKAGLLQAKTTLSELQRKGWESAQVAVKKTDSTIRSHPYEAVAISVGVGILVGLALGRR